MDQGALRQFASNYGDTEKRFIMFDYSGDKGRIMLEPNRFLEFDPRSPPPEAAAEAGEFHRVYREAMASFAAFQRMREENINNNNNGGNPVVTLCHLGDVKDSDSSMSKLSWDQHPDDEQQSSVREEDSEDIDALLYSDDDELLGEDEEEEECSTGHTPLSEVTREDSDEITSGFHVGEEKQPHQHHQEEEEEEDEMVKAEDGDGDDNDDKSCKWSGYSGSGAAAAVAGGKRKRPRLAAAGRRTVMKKQRKERIRRTVKALQSIVPGGVSMDPAVVLDEAILYMKLLQTRVRQLETSRQQDLSIARA